MRERSTSRADERGDVPRGPVGRSRRQLILPGDQSGAGNLRQAAAGGGKCRGKWRSHAAIGTVPRTTRKVAISMQLRPSPRGTGGRWKDPCREFLKW